MQEMDVGSVASDHQFAIGPLRIFVSADEESQGALIEDMIVGGFEFVVVREPSVALGSVMS